MSYNEASDPEMGIGPELLIILAKLKRRQEKMERGPMARLYAVVITDLEKLIAMVDSWGIQ